MLVNKIEKSFYSDQKNMVKMQLDSYNHFVNFGMQEIIDQEGEIIIADRYRVKFGQISLSAPQIIETDRTINNAYPHDSRTRSLDYLTTIRCDITETFMEDGEEEKVEHTRIEIDKFPVMVKSEICSLSKLSKADMYNVGECPNDPGGYFIIKGNERVLTGQLRAVYNRIFVLEQKVNDTYKYIAEIRSMSIETGHSALVKAMYGADDRTLVFSIPQIDGLIPFGIVFKALGFITEEEISSFIGMEKYEKAKKFITYIMRDSLICPDQKSALQYIGRKHIHKVEESKTVEVAQKVVSTDLFPHLGITSSPRVIAFFVGNVIRKLLSTQLGLRGVSDRDNLALKRVETPGSLIYEIFRHSIKKLMQNIKTKIEGKKQRPNIISIIYKENLKGFLACFSTGNWSVQKNPSYMKTGVSQVLERLSYLSSLSHRCRILNPAGKEGKNNEIRQIHASQYGFICSVETPEGKKCGLVSNLAIMAHITNGIPQESVRRVLDTIEDILDIDEIDIRKSSEYTSVYLNDVLIGMTEKPMEIVKIIKKLRMSKHLHREVSVSYDIIDNDILVYCDYGRYIRPLFVLKNNTFDFELLEKYVNKYDCNTTKLWNKLVDKGVVMYIDAIEIENSVIAMNSDRLEIQYNDYMEIDCCCRYGIVANTIVFTDHCPSPRNCFGCAQCKAGLGIPHFSYLLRTDTIIHVLHYAQRAICSTKFADYFKVNEMPSGINVNVAIMTHTGWNQEDSIIMNHTAIERGLFHLTTYKTVKDCEKKRDSYSHENIQIPPETSPEFKRKNANYSLLDENGIIRERVPLERYCVNDDCGVMWFNGRKKKCPECKTKSSKLRGGSKISVKRGDVIIGKVIVTTNKAGVRTMTDDSRVIEEKEEGVIDKVYTRLAPNGFRIVKIVIRKYRIPEPGDKLASRTAQKGTIGMILKEADMPFTSEGIIPDIIINSLCIPSRMTINQLIETLLCKICCVQGEYANVTPFTEDSVDVGKKVIEKGKNVLADPNGWEIMYNGKTGEKFYAKIFMGVTFYQRLKHMVADKLHARDEGRITMLTRQPLEGRSRDGGLRFGEMERDCMISHGAAAVLKERLYDVSDAFKIIVCSDCGHMVDTSTYCNMCRGDNIVTVNLPYASKLMFQELKHTGIKICIFPDKKLKNQTETS